MGSFALIDFVSAAWPAADHHAEHKGEGEQAEDAFPQSYQIDSLHGTQCSPASERTGLKWLADYARPEGFGQKIFPPARRVDTQDLLRHVVAANLSPGWKYLNYA